MPENKYKIAIIAPVPFYYHTPLYRKLNDSNEIDLIIYYCSDETLSGIDIKKMYGTNSRIITEDNLLSGYKHKFIRNFSFQPSYLKWPFGLMNFGVWQEIKKNKYDIVILQSWSNITWWVAFLACLVFKTPVFFMTDANILSYASRPTWKKKIKEVILGKILFKKASGFFVAGKANAQFYRYYGVPEKKLVSLPFSWGYEELLEKEEKSERDRDQLRAGFNIAKDDFVILYVGRLSEEKSPLDILDAYDNIKSEKKKLFIVGSGPLTKQFERRIEELGVKQVYLMGFQPREKTFDFYKASNILVLPSRDETWGIVVNEALCFGLPVIASNRVAAAVEFIKNDYNGFIYDFGDTNQIARYIERFIELDPEKRMLFSKRAKEEIRHWVEDINASQQIIKAVKILEKNNE